MSASLLRRPCSTIGVLCACLLISCCVSTDAADVGTGNKGPLTQQQIRSWYMMAHNNPVYTPEASVAATQGDGTEQQDPKAPAQQEPHPAVQKTQQTVQQTQPQQPLQQPQQQPTQQPPAQPPKHPAPKLQPQPALHPALPPAQQQLLSGIFQGEPGRLSGKPVSGQAVFDAEPSVSYYTPNAFIGSIPYDAGNYLSHEAVSIQDNAVEFAYDSDGGDGCKANLRTDISSTGLVVLAEQLGPSCLISARTITLKSPEFHGCTLQPVSSTFKQTVLAALAGDVLTINAATMEQVLTEAAAYAAAWQLDCKWCDTADPCCSERGRVKAKGALCRAEVGICETPGMCDGVTSTCPDNTPAPEGQPCQWFAPMQGGAYEELMIDASDPSLQRGMVDSSAAAKIMGRSAPAFPGGPFLCSGACTNQQCVLTKSLSGSCCFPKYYEAASVGMELLQEELSPEEQQRRQQPQPAPTQQQQQRQLPEAQPLPSGSGDLGPDWASGNWYCWL